MGALQPTPALATTGEDPISELFKEGGAVIGGAALLLGTVSFMAGAFANDLGANVDAHRWGSRGAQYGATVGIIWWILRPGGVQ